MGLIIKSTGLDQYAPGGSARIKILTIGGPGAGKTRWASYFPRPIYADCEAGLASVADRKVPYVSINTSQDMLDLLTYLKDEGRRPAAHRTYDTVVVDTLDAFQRKVKNEWMEANRKQIFQGWEAWGFLNAKIQLLMTRLLNLDLNVIVNVHYKDKTTKDDETGRESHSLMLQLQGESADSVYNDFDLVGWMEPYWAAENGERVRKRGLTFRATPQKPMLKDRLHITTEAPLEVTFSDSDYTNLFARIQARVDQMSKTETLGEIPTQTDEVPPAVASPTVIGSGPLPATPPREVPFVQLDKPTLIKRARDMGITTTVDGSPIRANTLKSELVAALEAAVNAKNSAAPASPATPVNTQPATPTESSSTPAPAAVANPSRTRGGTDTLVREPEGLVDTKTGEIHPSVEEDSSTEVTHEQAVENVTKTLGGVIVDDHDDLAPYADTQPVPKVEPAAPPASPPAKPQTAVADDDKKVCEVCGKDLAAEKADFVKLAWIKFRKRLCENDYLAAKSAPR